MFYKPLPIGRVCRDCGLWKPEHLLKKHKEHSTGRDALCKQCNSIRTQKRRAENPELAREKDRQYRQNNPERYRERDRKRDAQPDRSQYKSSYSKQYNIDNHDRLTEQKRVYTKEHPEMWRKANKKWSANNRDKVNAKNKRYKKRYPENPAKHVKLSRQRHPETKQAAEERRRARKHGLPDTFTVENWRLCQQYWHGCCAVCGRLVGTWHTIAADHWIPLTSPDCPGTVPTNMLPLCHSLKGGKGGCNNSKRNRDPLEWLTERLGPKQAKAKLAEITAYFASL